MESDELMEPKKYETHISNHLKWTLEGLQKADNAINKSIVKDYNSPFSINRVERMVNSMEGHVQNMSDAHDRYRATYNKAKTMADKADAAAEEKKKFRELNDGMQKKVDTLQAEVDELRKGQSAELKKEARMDQLLDVLEGDKEDVEKNKANLKEQDSEIRHLHYTNGTLTERNDNLTKRNESLEAQLKEANGKIDDLEKQLRELQARL